MKGITQMKKTVFVDAANEILVVTKAYYKRACQFGTPEYYELRKAQAENEGFEIVFGCDRAKKETYHGLTFERMETYINSQPNSEARMEEYKVVKKIAEIKGKKYPLTKKWFLLTYPEYKDNGVSENGKVILAGKTKAEAAKKTASNAENKPDLTPAEKAA